MRSVHGKLVPLGALLLALAAACGSQVSSRVSTPGASQLDLARATSALGRSGDVEVTLRLDATVGGQTNRALDETITTSRELNRARIVNAPNASTGSKGSEIVFAGQTLYAKGRSQRAWTELDIDPALLPQVGHLYDPGSSLSRLESMGLDLRKGATGSDGGVRVTHYSGPVDWQRMVSKLRSGSELSNQMFANASAIKDVQGTVDVTVTAAGLPRALTMDLVVTADGTTTRLHEVASYRQIPHPPRIAVPAASAIGRHVSVGSAADLTSALQEVITGKSA